MRKKGEKCVKKGENHSDPIYTNPIKNLPILELRIFFQQFVRVTSIGSLPSKTLGKSHGPPQNPAEPRRTLREPRRTLWETPAEPSERQISLRSLEEGCAPRMVTLRNFRIFLRKMLPKFSPKFSSLCFVYPKKSLKMPKIIADPEKGFEELISKKSDFIAGQGLSGINYRFQ